MHGNIANILVANFQGRYTRFGHAIEDLSFDLRSLFYLFLGNLIFSSFLRKQNLLYLSYCIIIIFVLTIIIFFTNNIFNSISPFEII